MIITVIIILNITISTDSNVLHSQVGNYAEQRIDKCEFCIHCRGALAFVQYKHTHTHTYTYPCTFMCGHDSFRALLNESLLKI